MVFSFFSCCPFLINRKQNKALKKRIENRIGLIYYLSNDEPVCAFVSREMRCRCFIFSVIHHDHHLVVGVFDYSRLNFASIFFTEKMST